MLLGIMQTLQGGNTAIDSINLSFTPTGLIKKALDEQNAIGWNNFYRGRIASSWNAVQQGHCKTRNNGKQDTTKWATAIITTLWHGFLQLWEARKDDQHGRDSAQKQEKERTLLLQRTRTLYDQLDQFDREEKRFFTTPIAEWEQKPNKDIQDWLLIAELLTEKSKSRARERATHSQQPLLTSFF